MKKLCFFILIIFICVSLYGCVTTRRVKKLRVDQDASGNAGYLSGDRGYSEEKVSSKKEREYFEIDIEVPPIGEGKEHYWEDNKISGNQGYISGHSQDE